MYILLPLLLCQITTPENLYHRTFKDVGIELTVETNDVPDKVAVDKIYNISLPLVKRNFKFRTDIVINPHTELLSNKYCVGLIVMPVKNNIVNYIQVIYKDGKLSNIRSKGKDDTIGFLTFKDRTYITGDFANVSEKDYFKVLEYIIGLSE